MPAPLRAGSFPSACAMCSLCVSVPASTSYMHNRRQKWSMPLKGSKPQSLAVLKSHSKRDSNHT